MSLPLMISRILEHLLVYGALINSILQILEHCRALINSILQRNDTKERSFLKYSLFFTQLTFFRFSLFLIFISCRDQNKENLEEFELSTSHLQYITTSSTAWNPLSHHIYFKLKLILIYYVCSCGLLIRCNF